MSLLKLFPLKGEAGALSAEMLGDLGGPGSGVTCGSGIMAFKCTTVRSVPPPVYR